MTQRLKWEQLAGLTSSRIHSRETGSQSAPNSSSRFSSCCADIQAFVLRLPLDTLWCRSEMLSLCFRFVDVEISFTWLLRGFSAEVLGPVSLSSSSSSNKMDSKCKPFANGLEESRLKAGLGGDMCALLSVLVSGKTVFMFCNRDDSESSKHHGVNSFSSYQCVQQIRDVLTEALEAFQRNSKVVSSP